MGGFNVNVGEDQQLKLAASYDKMIDELSSQQPQGTFIYGGNRANDVAELNSLFWWHLLYRDFLVTDLYGRNGYRHLLQANLRRL